MICLTWNLEWARPNTRRGELIRGGINEVDPEVVCYTEVKRDFVPEGHRIEADSDYGYAHNGTRRKVILWSKHPWEHVDVVGDPALPTGRFASGVSGGVRFVGVCIPWRDAHVTSGRKDRARWADHIVYCEGLGRALRRYAESNVPICVLGDYNQRIPRFRQPPRVAEALSAAFPPGFRIATEGMTDADGYGLIDHFAVSPGSGILITKIIPRITEDGTRLSDHVGVAASLDSRNLLFAGGF
jgi:endonuclease/exonuclease/phosphatase family metal-dependent hydrolase